MKRLPMGLGAALLASVTFAPAVAYACPFAGECACGSSLLGYGAAIAAGLAAGAASIALERRRPK